MIFKSIEDEAGNTSVKVSGILSNMLDSISALRAKASTESQFKFDDKLESSIEADIAAINSYNTAIDSGMSKTEALASCFKNASIDAKAFADATKEAQVSTAKYRLQAEQAQVSTQSQNKSLSNTRTLITEYNAILSDKANIETKGYVALSKSGLSQEEFCEAVKKSNPQLAKYLSGLQTAEGTTKGYVGSLIAAKAAAVGMRIATTALNAVVGMGIGLLLSFVASGFQKMVEEFLKTSDERIADVNQRLSETDAQIKQIAKDFSSLKQSADEVIPRFVELAKRVGILGDKGALTDEEYKEFISLNNKLAEMFPELNLGYDDNGNAMLALSFAADTLSESLYNLVQAEREASNTELVNKFPEQMKNIADQIDNYNMKIDDYNERLGYYRLAIDSYKPGNSVANSSVTGQYLKEALGQNAFDAIIKKYTKEIVYENGFKESVIDWDAVFGSDEVKGALDGLLNGIKSYEGRIESEWVKLMPNIMAWVQTDSVYDSLDELRQKIARELVQGLDLSALYSNGYNTPELIEQYITDNIITPLANASPEVASAFSALLENQELYKRQEITAEDFTKRITTTFEKAFSSLSDEGVKKLIEWMNALGVAGYDAESIIENLIDSFIVKVESAKSSFSSMLSAIDSLNSGLNQLDKIYADVINGEDFDFSSLVSDDFAKEFSVLGESYENFIEIIANSPNDIEACQSAFNQLGAEYILHKGYLNDVTDATRNVTIAMLEQMGVSNAAAIVDAELAYQKEKLKYTTGDYTDKTYDEIVELYNECTAGETAKQVLAELAVQKALVNAEQIKSSDDIEQIIALANAANATTASLQNLAKAKMLIAKGEELESSSERGGIHNGLLANAYYQQAQDILNQPISYNTIDPNKFKYSGGSSTRSARESAAKAADKASKEADKEADKEETWFEKQYKLHKHLVAMEQEDDEDYYAWLNSAMNQAYNEGILELDDYRKYQEEVFSGLRSLFKDYLNDVEHEIEMRENYDGESKKIISLYKTLISKVEAEIAAARKQGLTDEDDYIQELQDKWQSYNKAIKDIQEDITDAAKDALDDLVDYRIDMLKKDIENEKDALDKKLDNLKDFYDKQKEMLQDAADEEKYLDEQAEKRKSVTDLQSELQALQYDDSAWAQKRRLELNQQLADAQKELDDFEKEHALDLAMDAIDAAYDAQEAQIKAEMDALDEKLNDPNALFNQALTDIKNNSKNQLYYTMLMYNRQYGDGKDSTINEMWEKAYGALDEYQKLFGKAYEDVKLNNETGYKSNTGWDTAPVSDKGSSSSSSGSSSSSSKSTTTTTTTPKLDDDTKRKVAAAIWNGSYGWGTGTTRAARLEEVFGANNGIQSLVSQGVGKKDKAPGSEYTYLNMRKKLKGYWTGTPKASAGLHSLDELGTETIFESADGTKYKMFTGGEKVLNARASNFLYAFANDGNKILDKIFRGVFGSTVRDVTRSVNNNEIRMGDIIIQGSASKESISAIRRAQRESVDTMLKELNKLNR